VDLETKLPKIARADAGAVVVSEFTVFTPERQRTVGEEIVSGLREGASWPEGLLSANLFASTDGDTVLSYDQWTSNEAYHRSLSGQHRMKANRVDLGVSEAERSEPVDYRLYRSRSRDDAPPVGCVVIVRVMFLGPDEERQRRWVDTVFEALEAETELHPGGISGHFHLSSDGTQVLNYAEWTDEAAHREALAASGQGTIGPGPRWLEVLNFGGVVSNGFKRYKLLRSLSF